MHCKLRRRDALLSSFGPAYEAIIAWAEEERLSSPEVATGIGAQEGGDAYYAHLLAQQTTTDLSADEIHTIGLNEVARLRKEMLGIMDEVEFQGDLKPSSKRFEPASGITIQIPMKDVRLISTMRQPPSTT